MTAMPREVVPYGSWPTPITASRVVEHAVRLGNLRTELNTLRI